MNRSNSICPKRSDNPLSKAQDIAYVRLGRKQLTSSERYYSDFGLKEMEKTKERVLFSGANSDFPCWSVEKSKKDFLIGLGMFISTDEEFETLSKLNGASINSSGRFGNLPCVTLQDPSGLYVDAVLSKNRRSQVSIPEKRIWNRPGEIKRRNRPQSAEFGHANVLRLGHAVLLKQEFYKNAQWYCDTFGLIPSDIQILPESKKPVIVFLRCDLGETPTDHHTIVIASGIDDRLEHCAFELKDMDEIAKGREWLLNKGWKAAWGIGRHLLGSQIFDYKRDPSGMLVEHYTDGDKFDSNVPIGYHPINRKSLHQWGEDMPEDFLDTKLSLHKLKELLKGILNGREISLSKLVELKRVMKTPPRPWIKY